MQRILEQAHRANCGCGKKFVGDVAAHVLKQAIDHVQKTGHVVETFGVIREKEDKKSFRSALRNFHAKAGAN